MSKIFLEKAIFVNRAPFDAPLELSFRENEIVVLSAVNGRGKTTILSHAVDAFYEMAKGHFPNDFKGVEGQYYRVSSQIFNVRSHEPSFVYLRFSVADGRKIDYVDARGDAAGHCTPEQYDRAIRLENKVPFRELSGQLSQGGNAKLARGLDPALAKDVFHKNVLTYFPSYRYEQPGYLNDPYKIKLEFKKESGFSGYLPNPLEVVTGLRGLMNWIMDVVLDIRHPNRDSLQQYIANVTYGNLCRILSEIIHSKFDAKSTKIVDGQPRSAFRFGVGPRNSGSARISVHENAEEAAPLYPTLSTLSSGESSLLCIFGELLRQADKIGENMMFMSIQGIVLIDEIDKHLHIRLQREVLPRLLSMFPNVQFITTSHSPFFNIGLNESAPNRAEILSLPFGVRMRPADDPQYSEVYELMLKEEGRFKDLAVALQQQIDENREDWKPLLVTEGKTDVAHLKRAMQMLGIEDLDVEFFDGVGERGGSDPLRKLLEQRSRLPEGRIIVGIFDRDESNIVSEVEEGDGVYKHYGNNVYGMCLPAVAGNERCSIEHYYPDGVLKKEHEGRRLFTGGEFYENGNSKDGAYYTGRTLKKRIETNGIIDEKIYRKDDLKGTVNVALTKSDFAALVETEDFIGEFRFESFQSIFDRLRMIPGLARANAQSQ
jgi:hypothetical protein